MNINTPPQHSESTVIEPALRQAITFHQAGQLQKAGELYQSILEIQPNHPEANHNLGALAVAMEQPAAGLPYFMAALEADPARGQFWLSYIDALVHANQPDLAREVLALARQQGLEGDEVEALEARLESGTRTTAQSSPEHPSAFKESSPVSSPPLQSHTHKPKNKPTKPDKSTNKFAPNKGKAPNSQEINALVTLFTEGRLKEAETLARTMTVRFPMNGFGWKVLGAALKQMGRNADALAPMQKAAALSPNDADAHSNLGIILHDFGFLDESVASCQRAIEINPDFAEAHINLGISLHALRRLDEAEASYRRALKIKPDFTEAHNNLGNTLRALGRPEEAEACYRRALQSKPDFTEAHSNLGITLKELGRLDEAEASCRLALTINPAYAKAHSNLGVILHDLGRLNEAETSYRQALQIEPDIAEAHSNLGATLYNLDRLDEAEASYRCALEIKPDLADAYYDLGNTIKCLGRLEEAKASYRKAQQLGIYGARIKEALMLPPIMGTRQEILASRVEFERNLDALIADKVPLDDPLKSIGETNFYLAYQGLNDRDLQIKVAKYYEQACPSLLYTAPHCFKPKHGSQNKIRVGFLSKFLYSHSVSLCFSKIVEALSSKMPFEVTLISNHPIDKKIYSEFSGQRVHLPYNLVRAREMLAALELDILVYLDIGMEPLSYFLAFSRLAPVQCVLAGHPVTTGISNMDYFLSSGLMEPVRADEHYSEKLVRLPRPVFHFTRPDLPATLKTRNELNLPTGQHIYMCPMKLQKIHPDFDEALTRILQIDDNGVIVLFEDEKWPHWKNAMAKRFEQTIPAELRARIIFLPWLKDPKDFISAIAAADVVLDPFHFGIGSTAAMISVTGTPLVTKAGEFMRGRVGAFYCEILDLAECITEDTESYALKAVEIASNPLLREKISAKLLNNASCLYENLHSVEELVEFFYSLTGRGCPPGNS